MPIATLQDSNWGRTISLKEIGISLSNGRDMAFLRYAGNCRDFQIGAKYNVRPLFIATYKYRWIDKDGNEKEDWAKIVKPTYDEARNDPHFVEHKVSEFDIVPYFEIIL